MFRNYLTLSVGTYPPPTYCPHPTYLTQACLVPAAWILIHRQKADGEDVLAPICGYLYVAVGWIGMKPEMTGMKKLLQKPDDASCGKCFKGKSHPASRNCLFAPA